MTYLQIRKEKIDPKVLENKADDLERLSAAGNVKETASLTLTIAQVLNDPDSSTEVDTFCLKRNSFCFYFFLTSVHSFPLRYVNTEERPYSSPDTVSDRRRKQQMIRHRQYP